MLNVLKKKRKEEVKEAFKGNKNILRLTHEESME